MPPLNKSELSRADYEKWHALRAVDENSTATLQAPWNVFIQNHLPSLHGKTVLEIACGRGQLSEVMAKRGARVIAGDFSLRALEILAKERISENLYPLTANACLLPLKDASVDVIVSCETIEHVTQPQMALSEFRRVLKKDGLLLLTCPSYFNSYGLYRIYLKLRNRAYRSGALVQPIENWLFNFNVNHWLKKRGFGVKFKGGVGHYGLWPGKMPRSLVPLKESFWLNKILAPFALHSFFIAEKRR